MNNPCIRCGKQRINGKISKEKVGASEITYTQTICPDPECQKIVDEGIAERKAKTAFLTEERAKSKLAREKAAVAS